MPNDTAKEAKMVAFQKHCIDVLKTQGFGIVIDVSAWEEEYDSKMTEAE